MTWALPEVPMLSDSKRGRDPGTRWEILRSARWMAFAAGVICLCLGFWGCVTRVPPEPGAQKDVSALYDIEIEPLKPHDCAQCHPQIYSLVKNRGGRHRIDCRRCHVQFHMYRPGKAPYEEVIPKCSSCHGPVHGKELAECSGCHTEVHAPMNIPAGRALEQGCSVCHPDVDREMKTYITQHTDLYCISCHHSRHRYVPECQECHQPHTRGMTQSDCLTCHRPHKALQVAYPADMSSEACTGCHRDAYEALKQSNTKHTAVSCTKCHLEKHRTFVRCSECHPEAHGAAMLQKFSTCNQCHGAAHSLYK
jgi:predicted CXXCH cytochrome family protein